MDTDRLLVGVPRETFPGEAQVALVPTVLPQLSKAGMDVVVERSMRSGSGGVVDELPKLPAKEVLTA